MKTKIKHFSNIGLLMINSAIYVSVPYVCSSYPAAYSSWTTLWSMYRRTHNENETIQEVAHILHLIYLYGLKIIVKNKQGLNIKLVTLYKIIKYNIDHVVCKRFPKSKCIN